jgi:hypothetical protein
MTSFTKLLLASGTMFAARRAVFVDKPGEGAKDVSSEKKDAAGKDTPKEGTMEYFLNVDNRVTLYKKVWTKVAELEQKGDDKSMKQAARLRKMMKTAAENEKDPVDPAGHAERIYSALEIIEHPEKAKPMTPEEAETAMAWLDQQLGIPHAPKKPGTAVAQKPEEKKKEENKPEEKPAMAKKSDEKPAKAAKADDKGKEKAKAKPKPKDPLMAQLDAMDAQMKKGLEGGKPISTTVLKGSEVDTAALDSAAKAKDQPPSGLRLGDSGSGQPIKPGQGGLASIDSGKKKDEEKKPDAGVGVSVKGPKAPSVEDKPKEEVKLGTRMPDTIKKDYEDFQKDKSQTQRIVVRDNVQYRFVRVTSMFGGESGAKMTRIEVYKKELT